MTIDGRTPRSTDTGPITGPDYMDAVDDEIYALWQGQGLRNRLMNADGRINQRAATSAADDAYAWDRWYALTQTGAVGISSLSDVADGVPRMMRMTQSQATAQRMGFAQIIEGANCKDMRGKDACLSGSVRMSAAGTVRYAVLAWTGTEDTVTSDVVNDWTSGTFTPGNFFNGTSLSLIAAGSLSLSANALTTIPDLVGTVPSGMNNCIVMLWTDAAQAQNVTLDTRLQLERAPASRPFEVRPTSFELLQCLRYFERLSPTGGAIYMVFGAGMLITTTDIRALVVFSRKRIGPTITISNLSHFQCQGWGTLSALTMPSQSQTTSLATGTLSTPGTSGAATLLLANATSSAYMDISAEL